MPNRSQRHKEEIQGGGMGGYTPPPITAIHPDTASIVGAGVVDRVVCTLSVTGGTPPITYAIPDPALLAIAIGVSGYTVVTTADPVGPAGDHTITVEAADMNGSATETIVVTVT